MSSSERGALPRPSILRAGAAFVIAGVIAIAIALIDTSPDFSHVRFRVLSGSTKGNYFAIVNGLAAEASRKSGFIENVSTKGSGDNLARLAASASSCAEKFALVQDGMPWGDDSKLSLVARLSSPETVFFLGPNADTYSSFADLSGLRIGVGPEGSGTARLAKEIFASRGLSELDTKLSNHAIGDQIKKLEAGELDLGVFVISEDASLIDNAIRQSGLQIASFEHARSAARRLPFLSAAVLPAGHYDPVKVLPRQDKHVLKVDTLLVTNGCASRSETMALLSMVSSRFPGTIIRNTQTPNSTGLPLNKSSLDFFKNQGPEVLDEYAPWLTDYVPVGNLTYMVMAVSLLFNAMGFGNRFRLWRIDANRVRLEGLLPEIFGPGVIVAEIKTLIVKEEHRAQEKIDALSGLIAEFEELKNRCRSHSVSMLVPMGQEMGYRYQESLIEERLAALRAFRHRLTA